MSLSADAVTRIFEGRYDWSSARVMVKAAAAHAGADLAGPLDANALSALADSIAILGDHVDALVKALRNAAPAPAPVVSVKPTPAPPSVEAEMSKHAAVPEPEEAPLPVTVAAEAPSDFLPETEGSSEHRRDKRKK